MCVSCRAGHRMSEAGTGRYRSGSHRSPSRIRPGSKAGSMPCATETTRSGNDASMRSSLLNSIGTSRGVPFRSVATFTTPTAATSENGLSGSRNCSALGTLARASSRFVSMRCCPSGKTAAAASMLVLRPSASARAWSPLSGPRVQKKYVHPDGFRVQPGDCVDDPGKLSSGERIGPCLANHLVVNGDNRHGLGCGLLSANDSAKIGHCGLDAVEKPHVAPHMCDAETSTPERPPESMRSSSGTLVCSCDSLAEAGHQS